MSNRLRDGAGFETRPPATTMMSLRRTAPRDKNIGGSNFFCGRGILSRIEA
jgi:hypothetical protein